MQAAETDNGLNFGQHSMVLIVSILLSVLIHFGIMAYLGDHIVATVTAKPQREVTLQEELTQIQIDRFIEEMELASIETSVVPDATMDGEIVHESITEEAETTDIAMPMMPITPTVAVATPKVEMPELDPALPTLFQNPVRQEIAMVVDSPFSPEEVTPRWTIEKDIPRIDHDVDFALTQEVVAANFVVLPPVAGGGSTEQVLSLDEVIATSQASAVASVEASEEGVKEDIMKQVEEARDIVKTEELVAEAIQQVQAEVTESLPTFVQIDDRLNLNLRLYQTPLDPAHNYFKLTILRRPESTMPTMEKDVIFIQDVSGSIGSKRLKAINEATKSAFFNVLRIGDRYRVLAFRHEVLTTANEWSTVTADTFKREQTFIDSFRAKGSTDLYLLLQNLLSIPRDPKRPVIAVIVTDGEPTTGVLETTRIITEFSRANKGNISVYTFDAKRRNPYFLDMLCYTNRGENTTASSARDIEKLGAELKPVFESIRNPVMMNTFLTFDAASGGDVHPRKLTNLYADRPLIVYGKAPRTVKTITCQLHGVSATDNYDAVFSFDVAKVDRTTTDYRRAWAERAMFDFLAEYASNPSDILKTRIENFARNYGLRNPYAE